MPMFTRAEMNEHIKSSGKKLGDTDHHSVPTSFRKAKTFLEDEYLHEIEANVDQRYFYFRAKCNHSFKKNDPPHDLKLALCVVTGHVIVASCSCVAGKVGFCNHILALMLKCCKFTLFDSLTTKDLCKEQDENPSVACTSRLQKWHQKGGGIHVIPQPVMDIVVEKTKLDDNRSRAGVKCLLYEARKQPQFHFEDIKRLKSDLHNINPGMGISVLNPHEKSCPDLINTKLGKSPVGSYLSYQASYTEANFTATADLNAIARNSQPLDPHITAAYPRFPLRDRDDFVYSRKFSDSERKYISHLSADENQINNVERRTRDQSESHEWKLERMYRFTASKFDAISKRQRNHDTFANSLMHPKHFTSKYVEHGIKYEPVALHEYEKFMKNRRTPVVVLNCGLIICKGNSILAATPDAKVIDVGCVDPFGLAEIKCPQTKFHVTPLDACSDPNFCLQRDSDDKCKLKRSHSYFKQVQGQMGIAGAQWCDFIVYTGKGLHVERIAFDEAYWKELERKLVNYYLDNFLQYAVVDFQSRK